MRKVRKGEKTIRGWKDKNGKSIAESEKVRERERERERGERNILINC